MTLASMTGFARADGRFDNDIWVWEAKSVNHRGLDVRCRMPTGFDHLEPVARKAITARAARGAFQVALQWKSAAGRGAWRLNEAAVEQLLDIVARMRKDADVGAPRADGILALPGVLEPDEPDEDRLEERDAQLRAGLDTVLDRLIDARKEEGARLQEMVIGHIDAIAQLSADAKGCAAARAPAIRSRFQTQLTDLLGDKNPVPEDRLAQEIAMLAVKADIREELDRLAAHCAAARDLLAQSGPVGRKLDFLCQEFGREANTLCAKSSDKSLTRIGLDLKARIDQLREQVQNIE